MITSTFPHYSSPMKIHHPLMFLGAAVMAASADVTLPALFSDHVVLQRNLPLPVWGWASPGEKVEVVLGKERASATANPDGKWLVRLAPQPVSKEPLTLTVTGANKLEVRDVLLGDVWLCSGQSNMDWGLGGCNVPADIAAADLPQIRHFRTEYNFASTPATTVKGQWNVCSPGTAPGFSAVGFYFARKINAATGIPIGLLTNAVGGTNIELWMCQETLLTTPALESYANQMRESLAVYQQQLRDALPAIERWTKLSRTALGSNQPIPLPPQWPEYPFGERVARPRCVTLHNGHIAPLVPLAMRGVLWYQGESNAGDPLYLEKTAAMVADWRKWFANPKLPFYFVQLAAFEKPDDNPAGGGWGPIRDLQRRCLGISNTGMACAIDIGDAADIHPQNKFDVGERLARWALANDYGKADVVTSGPLFRELKIEGNKARVFFDSLGGGLVAARKEGRAAPVAEPGAKLQRFAIAGADKQWVWAEAVIDGDTVVVSSPQVAAPVAVRYAFSSNPTGANLYNRAGLPASPFRTDSW
jgi:sialate O-acetylesterase